MPDYDRPKPIRPCECRNRGPCARNCRDNYTPLPELRPQAQPPPPMLGLPPRQNQGDHSLLVTGMTIMGSMLCSALILCIFFALVRFYFNRRINQSSRRSFPVGFFGSRDDFFLDEDQIMPHLDNPIWYINTIGLQQSVIDSITVFKYRKDGGFIEGTECSVCLNEFQEDESLRLLPKCTHGFHLPCIDTWLRSHQNCPLCRAPVVSDAMVAQTGALEPNSNGSSSSNETAVENDVGEGGTGACRIEYGNTSENSRKILGHSDGNVLSDLDGIQATRRSVSLDLACATAMEATAEHKHGCSLDSELEELQYSKGKIGVKQSMGSSSICKLMKSCSVGRSLSKGPLPMKRSVSSAGIFLLSKPSKTQGSILPL
ncbi:hypothetical protein HRI_000538900 [Hibiscus trionum]|uniref:RING-type E3 ubiquitin transferase n=1 Tax=Hibiscus trionum TaxID=183268 RepID=A0A9W7H2M7_HIBTR|nr:hypothetical protein HRI_000538900 [Hibiscus trionum]